jgi:hypothetical protein
VSSNYARCSADGSLCRRVEDDEDGMWVLGILGSLVDGWQQRTSEGEVEIRQEAVM